MDTTNIIVDYFKRQGKEVDVDENLYESGKTDSIDIVELIAHLEDVHGIVIPPQHVNTQTFRSVRAIAEAIGQQ